MKELNPKKDIFGEGPAVHMPRACIWTANEDESDRAAERRFDRVMLSIGFVWEPKPAGDGRS